MKIPLKKRTGSAAVEFCVTLPMYLIMFFGVLYFGQATFVDQEMNIARAFATFSPEQDSDGTLNRDILSDYMGVLNVSAKGSKNAPDVPGPDNDVDQDGETDKFVDIQRVSLSGNDGQTEQWSGRGSFSTENQLNSGPFSNFDHDFTQDTPVANPNRLWMNWPSTILLYDYTPDFAHFVYGGPMSREEYINYSWDGSDSSQANQRDCRGCHSSVIMETNFRRTSLDYRSRQSSQLPTQGQEAKLWNQLKVKDMQLLLEANGTGLDTTLMPPADTIRDDGQGLERKTEWDVSTITNYDLP